MRRRLFAPLVAAVVAIGISGVVVAGPRIGQREVLSFEADVLGAALTDRDGADVLAGRVPIDRETVVEADLGWPAEGDRSRLALSLSRTDGGARPFRVRIDAQLTLPDGDQVHTRRDMAVDDDLAVLVEIHRVGRRSLTLAVSLAIERETFVDINPAAGRPVRMVLEIHRVDEGRVTLLERNQLQSFVGRSVGYAFRLGQGETRQSAEIRLTPTLIRGALATIRVDVSGRLPGPDGTTMTSRTDSLVTNRGATSTLAVESGDPPSGYRFLVTPDF